MKKILFLLLLSTNALAQVSSPKPTFNDFMLVERVEDQEKQYNTMLKELPAEETNDYRAELAFAWLAKGNVERYKYYKATKPQFSFRQSLYLANALEKLFDEKKNYADVEAISAELLAEFESGAVEDALSRTPVLMELNAASNARLGNIEIAKKMIAASTADKGSSARDMKYFKDMKSNYLNRYAIVLSAAGQQQEAFDLLTKAFREADSNPYMVDTFKEVYQKVKGTDDGFVPYLASLQREAYQHYYSEVEKEYIQAQQQVIEGFIPNVENPSEKVMLFNASKPVADITLQDLNGQEVSFADHIGKILVVDFWTTLCTPCVAAFSGFEKVVQDYSKKDLQLYVINLFEEQQSVKSYVAQKGITLDVLRDEENLAYNVQGTPTKIVFDPAGNIRFYGAGYAGSTDREYYKLKAMVEITKNRAAGLKTGV